MAKRPSYTWRTTVRARSRCARRWRASPRPPRHNAASCPRCDPSIHSIPWRPRSTSNCRHSRPHTASSTTTSITCSIANHLRKILEQHCRRRVCPQQHRWAVIPSWMTMMTVMHENNQEEATTTKKTMTTNLSYRGATRCGSANGPRWFSTMTTMTTTMRITSSLSNTLLLLLRMAICSSSNNNNNNNSAPLKPLRVQRRPHAVRLAFRSSSSTRRTSPTECATPSALQRAWTTHIASHCRHLRRRQSLRRARRRHLHRCRHLLSSPRT